MKLRDLDLGWLTIVAVGMFSHVNNICLVGFCGDPSIAAFQVDLPFALFILAVLTFVADHCWYPTSLKKPHASILLFINVAIALTISNLTLKFIWLPLQAVLMSTGIWLSNWVFNKSLVEEEPRSTTTETDWPGYFTNFLEHHSGHAVPTPMLRFAPEETDVERALLQWTDESLPFAVSVALSLVILGTRFFGCGFWDRMRQAYVSTQAALKRRRGRILLLPGGSLARLRSLAPRYVLSKVDDSDDEPITTTSTVSSAAASAALAPLADARSAGSGVLEQRERRPPPAPPVCSQPTVAAAPTAVL